MLLDQKKLTSTQRGESCEFRTGDGALVAIATLTQGQDSLSGDELIPIVGTWDEAFGSVSGGPLGPYAIVRVGSRVGRLDATVPIVHGEGDNGAKGSLKSLAELAATIIRTGDPDLAKDHRGEGQPTGSGPVVSVGNKDSSTTTVAPSFNDACMQLFSQLESRDDLRVVPQNATGNCEITFKGSPGSISLARYEGAEFDSLVDTSEGDRKKQVSVDVPNATRAIWVPNLTGLGGTLWVENDGTALQLMVFSMGDPSLAIDIASSILGGEGRR